MYKVFINNLSELFQVHNFCFTIFSITELEQQVGWSGWKITKLNFEKVFLEGKEKIWDM